jgi:hypothetical protein
VLHADSVRYFGGTETNLIQWLILHETTSFIEIHTQLMTPRVITQGTENATGTVAHFLPGRVATTFSLQNDGVLFTPFHVDPVPIHTIYSGMPPAPPGIIFIWHDSLYVEILDVEQFLGRPASATDVRIGPSWEVGTPALDFEILDLNQDGLRDIRLRWNLWLLFNNGHIGFGMDRLQVWGVDPTDGRLYYGEHPLIIAVP